MSEWKTVRLGDVCVIITGNTPSTKNEQYYSSKDIPFIKPSDLPANFFSEIKTSEFFISESARPISRIIPKNSVLVSCIGIIGKVGISKREVSFNQQINALIPNINQIDYKYLASAILNKKKYISEKANAAVVPIINKTEFSNLEIPLPPLETQKQIAAVLDKCTSLISKYKKMLEKYDTLIKSRFIEMFGDPILNSKGYNYKKLEELGKWESGGTPSRKNSDYFKGTIPWYSAGELNSLYLYDSNEKITENAIKESSAKLFRKGSLFVGMYDTAAFKMGIATSDCSSNQACANILPNKEVNVLWLYYILLEMKEFFLQNRRGVRQKNLNLGMIKGFEIPYATIDLQNKFATFVQQIDKSKFEINFEVKAA